MMMAPIRRPGYGKQSFDLSTSFGTLDLNVSTATFDYNTSVTTFAANADGGSQPAQFAVPGEATGTSSVLSTGGLLSTHLEGGCDDEEDEKEDEQEDESGEEIVEAVAQELQETIPVESSDNTPTKTRISERRCRRRSSSTTSGDASIRRRSSSGGRPRSRSGARPRSNSGGRPRSNSGGRPRSNSGGPTRSSSTGRRRSSRRHQKKLEMLDEPSPSEQLKSDETTAENEEEKNIVNERDELQENEDDTAFCVNPQITKSNILLLEKIPSTPMQEPTKDNDAAEHPIKTPLMTPSMVDKVACDGGLCFTSPTFQHTPTAITSEATATPSRSRVEKSKKKKKFYNGKSFKWNSKKTVQFPLCLVTDYHTDALDGGQRDIESTWYSSEELTQIKSSRSIDVKMALSGEPEKAPYCYRGIDVTLQQLERREQNVERSRKAVLAEQEQPKSSVKSIAKVYSAISASCQIYANTVGKLDEKAVMYMDPTIDASSSPKDGGLASQSDHGKPPRARRSSIKDALSHSDHGARRRLSSKSKKDDGLSNSEHGGRPPMRRRIKQMDLLSPNGSDHSSHSFSAETDGNNIGGDSPMTMNKSPVVVLSDFNKKATNIKRRISKLGRGGKKDSAFASLLDDDGNDSD